MIQTTSIESHNEIKKELCHRQLEVLNFLAMNGASSNAEIARGLHLPINSITPRTNELVKKEYLEQKGKTIDTESKRRTIVWGIKVDQQQLILL